MTGSRRAARNAATRVWVCMLGAILVLAVCLPKGFADEPGPVLGLTDCGKCHGKLVRAFKRDGLAHAESFTCLDCHTSHPPEGERSIPECSRCHEPAEQLHYANTLCGSCHDPHTPRDAVLVEPTAKVCLECHPEVGETMAASPSYHAEIDCAGCHEHHRQMPTCGGCHASHAEALPASGCGQCHRHHGPKPVRYGLETRSVLCAACHPEPLAALNRGNTRHSELTCAFCHREPHGTIPECIVCHGQPHGERIHSRHEQCVSCHDGGHTLVL